MNKKTLRQTYLRQRQSQSWTSAATQCIEHLDRFLQAHRGLSLGAYWPIREELDFRGAFEYWRKDFQVNLALPKIVGDEMIYVPWDSWENGAVTAWGIWEAFDDKTICPDVLLCPSVALDTSGVRLGYGGGFFDRFLQQHPQCMAIGVAAECFVFSQLPCEGHDRRMDALLSENGFVCLNEKAESYLKLSA